MKHALSGLLAACLMSLTAPVSDGGEAGAKVKKEKLQIVFLLGQSNMVGMSDVRTAWYLTQPQYVPPRELARHKSEIFDWSNLYWQGVRTFEGPQGMKDQLLELLDERRSSRDTWRQRIKGSGPWNEAEWGPKPEGGRDTVYAFLDKKAVEEGIYKRMADILDSPQNKFPAENAYEEIINRDLYNAAHIKRIREIYLNGTKGEDFDAFDKAVNDIWATLKGAKTPDWEATRAAMAEAARDHVNLPIAKRTRITGYGAIAGNIGEGITSETQGPLSIGMVPTSRKLGLNTPLVLRLSVWLTRRFCW